MSNWIPISKKLPPNKENVLITWGGGNVSCGYYVKGGLGGWFFENLAGNNHIPYEPIAWMSLPAPYKN